MKRVAFFLVIILSISNLCKAQSPSWDWIKKAGATGDESGFSTTVDKNGNILVAGYFTSSIVFGSYTLSSSGASDFFITKYDPNGNVIWAKKGGGTSNDHILSITTDPFGNILVTGAFQSSPMTIDFVSLSNSGLWDVFVARLDPQGNLKWAKKIIGPDHDNVNCVIADSTSIVIGGSFKQNIIVDTDTLINASSGTYAFDIFLVKYDTLGNAVWSKRHGGLNEDGINSLSFDKSGNILATGNYGSSSIAFGSYTLTNSGGSDVFLTKYTKAGNVIWVKKASGTSSDVASSITVDQNNNPIISGTFSSSKIYFNNDSLINIGAATYDIFVAKYDSNGNVIWVKRAGGTSTDADYAISSDPNNNILIAGVYTNAPFCFAGDTLATKGSWDIFLAKYNGSGNEIWAKTIGGNDYDEIQGNSLSVAPSGSIVLTGWFYSDTTYFDTIPLINANAGNLGPKTKEICFSPLYLLL